MCSARETQLLRRRRCIIYRYTRAMIPVGRGGVVYVEREDRPAQRSAPDSGPRFKPTFCPGRCVYTVLTTTMMMIGTMDFEYTRYGSCACGPRVLIMSYGFLVSRACREMIDDVFSRIGVFRGIAYGSRPLGKISGGGVNISRGGIKFTCIG